MINIDNLTFRTPQLNQGQIVTVSYAVAEGCIVRRHYDASDRTTSYDVAEIDWPLDDERCAEYDAWDPANEPPPKSWYLQWTAVDEQGRDLSTIYTYTIYDADPNSSGGTEWPDSTDIEIAADSVEEAIKATRDAMEVGAAGLSESDGYEVGRRLYALVWDHDGTIVGTPTYEITADDLGVDKGEQ